ncbi:MAG: hypothetical protein JO079_02860 [Frankiaceae bacterium]|nr:hypothetical protein [Frankiaceae bacterium]
MNRRAVVAFATLATALTVLVPAGASPGTPVQDTAFGSDPSGNPALNNASSITAGPYGVDVVTSDGPVHMTSAGEVAYAPSMAGVGGFATDASGRGFVTQSGQNAVTVLDRTGAVQHTYPLSQFAEPSRVVVEPSAPDNNGHELVWVAVVGGVAALDPSITDTTTADAAVVEFVPYVGWFTIAPDHSFVVVGSQGSSKLSHYSRQGVYLGDVVVHDSYGNVVVATGLPSFDGSGTMFIPDGNHVVEATLDGTYLGIFGQSDPDTSAPHPPVVGQLDGVTATAVDCRGRLMVLDGHSGGTGTLNRVVRFSGVGTSPFACPADPPVTSVQMTGFGSSIAVDRAAQVYAGGNGVIAKFDVAGHRIATIGTAGATPGQDGGLGYVFGIAVADTGEVFASSNEYVDANGNIVAQQDPKIVEFHSAGGNYVHQWRGFTEGSGTTAFKIPGDLLIRPSDKHLFVLDFGLRRLLEFTQSMTLVRSFTPTPLPGTLVSSTPIPTAYGFRPDGSLLLGVHQKAAAWTKDNPQWVSTVEHFSAIGEDIGDGWAAPTLDGSQTFVDGWIITRPDSTMLWSVASNLPSNSTASEGVLLVDAQGHVIRRTLEGSLAAGTAPLLAPDCRGNLVANDNMAETYRVVHYATGTCVWLPTATTGAMTKHTTTAVTVAAAANPSGQVTKMRILYGLTTKYGKATAWVTLPPDNTVQSRTFAITGLLTAHTYHYRVQVQNNSGTVLGADRTAKTL